MSQTASPHCERGVGGCTKGVPSGGASRRAAATRGADPRGAPDPRHGRSAKTTQNGTRFRKGGVAWRGVNPILIGKSMLARAFSSYLYENPIRTRGERCKPATVVGVYDRWWGFPTPTGRFRLLLVVFFEKKNQSQQVRFLHNPGFPRVIRRGRKNIRTAKIPGRRSRPTRRTAGPPWIFILTPTQSRRKAKPWRHGLLSTEPVQLPLSSSLFHGS